MRDWLKKKYGKRVGLGDIIREHSALTEMVSKTALGKEYNEEYVTRLSELHITLNHMFNMKTPIFPDEFNGSLNIHYLHKD